MSVIIFRLFNLKYLKYFVLLVLDNYFLFLFLCSLGLFPDLVVLPLITLFEVFFSFFY